MNDCFYPNDSPPLILGGEIRANIFKFGLSPSRIVTSRIVNFIFLDENLLKLMKNHLLKLMIRLADYFKYVSLCRVTVF